MLVASGLLVFASIIFGVTLVSGQIILGQSFSVDGIFIFALSIFLFVLGVEPARQFLTQVISPLVIQRKFDYRRLLKDAPAIISKIKSLDHLLSLVVHFVTMRLKVKNAAVLMHDAERHVFSLVEPRGYAEQHRARERMIFNEQDPFIRFLASEHAPLSLVWVRECLKVDGSIQKLDDEKENYDFRLIESRMQELSASCCIPSFLGKELRNVLILGERKSGEVYLEEDLNALYLVAQESAIAVENARLYDQAVEKAKELEVINRQLNQAQNQLIQALRETEVANKRLRDTHVQLIHEQKMATLGRLASSVGHEVNNPLTILSMNVSRAILKYRRNPDLKVSEITDTFEKMEQNISRIKAVVNTLTGLLKKSEHGKFEPLSLKLVLEETLPLVQFQTYLENLSGTEVEFDIPNNLPLIKGDLERLQEVFLNLFINAYHAMIGKRNRRITVSAREHPAHPAMVILEFTDNGCGMSDEVMKKIFSYGFTTKPAGKGSGMGLYMCHYIVELHGGEIKVRSKVGEGTTFVITLPTYEENVESNTLEKQ